VAKLSEQEKVFKGKLQNFKREINLTKNGAKFMLKKKTQKKSIAIDIK